MRSSTVAALVVAVAAALGNLAQAGPPQAQRQNAPVVWRPTRLYRLVFRRPRDPSRYYFLLGRSAAGVSSIPQVKLPSRGAALSWRPPYAPHRDEAD